MITDVMIFMVQAVVHIASPVVSLTSRVCSLLKVNTTFLLINVLNGAVSDTTEV